MDRAAHVVTGAGVNEWLLWSKPGVTAPGSRRNSSLTARSQR